MKHFLMIAGAVVLVSSGAAGQGGDYNGNRNDLARIPESGPIATPGGGATTGPNYRNLSVTPLPGSREEMDEILRRPNEAMLPSPEIRPMPGPASPPARKSR